MGYLRLRHSSRNDRHLRHWVAPLALLFLLLPVADLVPNVKAEGLTPFREVATASTGQTLSITINRPLATLADDVLIAAITLLSPNPGIVFTPPAGWIPIRQDVTPGEIAQALFYKVATDSEPANYTFSHNQSREASGAIAAYWGIDTTNPIDTHAGQYNSGAPPTTPSINTTTAGTTLLAIFGTKTGTVLTPPAALLGPPANMIGRWQRAGINGIQGFDEHFSGSGATGTRTSGTIVSPTVGQMLALNPARDASGTVLFLTRNLGSLTVAEQVRVDLLESWGYTVRQLYSNADPATEIPPELALADVVYISEEVPSNNVRNDYTNSCVGVVLEEGALPDDFLLAAGSSNYNSVNASILTIGHYITQPFLYGNMQLFTSIRNNQLHYLTGLAAGAARLASVPAASNNVSLAAVDIGATLTDGSAAAGRRVFLPWGTSQMTEVEILELTGNGQQMLRRSLDWAMAANSCSGRLVKLAFLPDGTPLSSGEVVPVGNRVKFLIYLNNPGAAQNDISVRDILDPGFLYNAATIKTDNSYTCATNPCSAADAANIFAAIDDNAPLTDIPGDDIASFTSGNTIDAGNSSQVTNAQLDIAANRVWAILFTVQMQ